ncbi:glycosyltransferase family 2 protein [Hyperthermus butylicus]|uniref:Universally conserved protein n=1 Tax=Hyperthermus butylicus (strain DSM 5456 / JCM 9403 / PLM1-5) TaxID=415426 RepID=A2BLZ4_HYPBU|nr:glycosyltransferase [Hyperthermus butylicus]ABM81005.1 universally conserved protein [Hyperthermus butylicus DSM 5456]
MGFFEDAVIEYFFKELYWWPIVLRETAIDILFILYVISSAVLGVYAVFYISSFIEFLMNGSPRPRGYIRKMSPYGWPRVGIIVPVYNDYEVLSSLEAIMRIDYPYVITIVVDDSTDSSLSHEISNISVRSNGRILHLKREGRKGLKAGALNEAIEILLEMYNVDYILILDADFEPPSDMVLKLVELAFDEEADIVQGYQRHVKGSNTLFGLLYRASMAGAIINIVGRYWLRLFPFFTGSCGLISRRVLEAVRFREGSLSEDFRLTIDAALSIPNLKVIASHEAYANGSVPRTQRAFWRQQIRWSVGTLDEFFKTFVDAVSSENLTFTEKIGYILQGLFFTNGLWVYVNTIVPLILALAGYGRLELVWPIGVYLWLIGIETLVVAGCILEKCGYMNSVVVAGYMILMIYYTALIHAIGTLKYLITRRAVWHVTSKRGKYERFYSD